MDEIEQVNPNAETFEGELLAELRKQNEILAHQSELILGVFVQMTRVYDVLLSTGATDMMKRLAELHEKGGVVSSYPTLASTAFDEQSTDI